jgi:hypothetical protein
MRLYALVPVIFWPALFLPVIIWAGMAGAGEWRALEGAAMRAALEGRRVTYADGAWQEFRASGRTLYNAGRDSWGYWRVQGAFYCSQWPPSDLWACYGVQGDGAGVRFIDSSGEESVAVYTD